MKYLKTYEDYNGQILAGNTANTAPMNVNNPPDKQPGIGDAIDFKFTPDGKKETVKTHGKILSVISQNGNRFIFNVTLNVEGSPYNKKGISDESNAVKVTWSEDDDNQFLGIYQGLRNPTGSGFVSQNTNIDVVAKTAGEMGANDGTGNFGSGSWPTDHSGWGL